MHPGYPTFIDGSFGERPLQPPLGILNADDTNKIMPTMQERANFVPGFQPGALYTDTCPCSTDCNLKVFELALVQAKVTYNRYGWHDPQGRFFVLKEELERHGGLDAYLAKVEAQKIHVEPLVIRANAGDCIEIRLTNLLPEHIEESPFQMHTLTDIAGFHIHLVKFDTIVSDGAANGDYLYYFGGIDDAWLGLWGIIRTYRYKNKHLKPICKSKDSIIPLPLCPPPGAVIRKYEIAAIQRDIPYNKYGDHDPDGLLFVPLADAGIAMQKNYKPKPLILRANVGDWIEVTLHNLFEKPIPYFNYPKVPLDCAHKPSMRVSVNPQFLSYDPVCDSGINVGYNNHEQTVGVGESKKYLWYADKEYGSCIIQSFGDMRNHRYHGLFGAIIIEPACAKWYKSFSPCKTIHDESAAIVAPGMESFRECVTFIQNGIRLLDKDGQLIKTAAGQENEEVDAEDSLEAF